MRYVETISPDTDRCIHCTAYVNCPDPVHDPACPEVTGVWPCGPREVDEGFACSECLRPFTAGELYTRPQRSVLCIGCAAVQAGGKA